MSNRSFNEVVVPLLQPDPEKPGSTVDPRERVLDAMTPRREDPRDTGFSISLARATGSAELREWLDVDVSPASRTASPPPETPEARRERSSSSAKT